MISSSCGGLTGGAVDFSGAGGAGSATSSEPSAGGAAAAADHGSLGREAGVGATPGGGAGACGGGGAGRGEAGGVPAGQTGARKGNVPVQVRAVRPRGRLGEPQRGGLLLPGVVQAAEAAGGARRGAGVVAASARGRPEGAAAGPGAACRPGGGAAPGRHSRRTGTP